MKPEYLLKEAKHIMNQRSKEYGDAKEMFGKISRYWSIYLDRVITVEDVSMMMALMKIARTSKDKKADSYVDCINYCAFAGSFAVEEEERERELNEVMQYFEG